MLRRSILVLRGLIGVSLRGCFHTVLAVRERSIVDKVGDLAGLPVQDHDQCEESSC
jgi:hypothetical protein